MSEELLNQNEQSEAKVKQEETKIERCLTFESGGIILFLSTDYIEEILNDQTITYLPMLPHFVKGVINLRGQILPVVDVRLYMDKEQAEYTNKTCIIVLNIDSVSVGIIVDSVRQVMDIDLMKLRPIPVKRQQKLLNGMMNMEDGTVLMSFDYKALIGTQY